MEEENVDPRVVQELYFLIAKFLSGGPLKETAKTLVKELQSVEVLPRRLDWEGHEHTQSYEEICSQFTDLSWFRLAAVVSQCVKSSVRPLSARVSILTDSLVRQPPIRTPYTQDQNIARRLYHREWGYGSSSAVGGKGGPALFTINMLTGLQLQRRTLGHLSAVYCVVYDCTGKYVITGADDLLVKVWSSVDGRLLGSLRGAGAEITDIAVSPDGALVAAGSVDKQVRVWNLESGAPTGVLSGHTGTITSVRWSPRLGPPPVARVLCTTSTDGSIMFWTANMDGEFDTTPVQFCERLRPGAAHMLCCAWSPGGSLVAAGSVDHHLRVYNLTHGVTRVLETPVGTDAIDSLQWAHQHIRLLSGSKDGTAALWRLHATQWRHSVLRPESLKPEVRLKVSMVCWTADDSHVCTALSDHTVRVWDSHTAQQRHIMKCHSDEAYVLESHPFLRGAVLSAGHDGRLVVWDVLRGVPVWSYTNSISGQGEGAVFDAKWNPDGSGLAATDSHGHLLLCGLGRGSHMFRTLPLELFFHTDYRPLSVDLTGGSLDEQSGIPPHALPPPFLVDVEGSPHGPELQRLVPGRGHLERGDLVPRAQPQDQLDRLIEALARRHEGVPGDGVEGRRGPWGSEGVRRARGDWGGAGGGGRHQDPHSGGNSTTHHTEEGRRGPWGSEGVRRARGDWGGAGGGGVIRTPTRGATVQHITQRSEELFTWECSLWRREMRRRPVMICTEPVDKPRRRRQRPPKPAAHNGTTRPTHTTERSIEMDISGLRSDSSSSPSSSSPTSSCTSSSSSAATRRRRRPPVRRRGTPTDSDDTDVSDVSMSASTYSDWEKGSDLEPPKRSLRKHKATRRYSPSVSTSKRVPVSAPTASTASTASATPAPPGPVVELPEVYRPGEWVTSVAPRKAPYHPQMGDVCLYFKAGHQRYFEAVCEKGVYKVLPHDRPWERMEIYECELVKVVGVKYVIRPPRIACLRVHSISHNRPFTIRYHDMPDVIDFLVLSQQYDAAVARVWNKGDRFRCMIDDNWWHGVVTSPPPPGAGALPPSSPGWSTATAALYLSTAVTWDNGEVERLSVWDLEPTDPHREPDSLGSAVPVTAHELESVLYRPSPEEWGGGPPAAVCSSLSSLVTRVLSLSAADPFSAPVDLLAYPNYARLVPYPMDLTTIKNRLDNMWYRRIPSVQFDVRYIASNAEMFNRPHSHIVRQARLITDLMLHIISNWEEVDVVAKFHEMAANYHSTDEEVTTQTNNRNKRPPWWKSECGNILRELTSSADSEPFREPVNQLLFPDYPLIVRESIDLGTVLSKLESGSYSSAEQFASDVRLVFANSRLYNTNKRSRIYSMTVRLSSLFESLWRKRRQRHNTRTHRRTRNTRTIPNGVVDSPPASTSYTLPPPVAPPTDPTSDSDSEPLAHTSRRVHAQGPHGKGKGIGKKSKVLPSTSTNHNGEHHTDEQRPHNTRQRVVEVGVQSPEHELEVETWEDDHSQVQIEYDRSTPEHNQNKQCSLRSPRKRRKVRMKSSSDEDLMTTKRRREAVLKSISSSSSSSVACDSDGRYESDRSYRPRYDSDDDQPLTLLRQRQEEAGSRSRDNRPEVSVSLRVRPRREYNEDSDSDGPHAISRRRPPLQLGVRSTPHTSRDHNHTRERDDNEPTAVSISSRGRVRKMTARARGID